MLCQSPICIVRSDSDDLSLQDIKAIRRIISNFQTIIQMNPNKLSGLKMVSNWLSVHCFADTLSEPVRQPINYLKVRVVERSLLQVDSGCTTTWVGQILPTISEILIIW